MSAVLTLDSVALATPDGRTLVSGLSLSVANERVGIVGRNGAGKSTLLRAILGELAPRSGRITRKGTVGMLRQAVDPGPETAAAALRLAEPLARLRRIEAGEGSEEDFARADWLLPARVGDGLSAVGLPNIQLDRPIADFSGGERTRIAIAGLLIDPPDLLLLDEPTNNLDEEGRAAVAQLLGTWRGGALVVSHDRELLEIMDRIVALSPTGAVVHGGGWSSYVDARDAERERVRDALERASRELRGARRTAQVAREGRARRDAAGRSYGQSGSAPKILMGRQRERAENSVGRETGLAERRLAAVNAALDNARARVEVVTPLAVSIPSSGMPPGKLGLSFREVSWTAGERNVIEGLSFEVRGPERIAVVGPNGAGKSTMLRLAAGLLEPSSGTIERPVPLALLDQGVNLLDRATTIADSMRRLNPQLSENQVRAALARFAFRNVEGDRLAGDLSGGECLRAGLACILSAEPTPQLLMLDEPTNHLDLESIEVIEQALRDYDGALMVVSHDRTFREALVLTREIRMNLHNADAGDR